MEREQFGAECIEVPPEPTQLDGELDDAVRGSRRGAHADHSGGKLLVSN
jgi:hypothetical protein